MSLKIQRIYDNKDYLQNTKESYIERQEGTDKWEAPCKPSADGSVTCTDLRREVNSILALNEDIENTRSRNIKNARRDVFDKQYEIDYLNPKITDEKDKQKGYTDEMEMEVAKSIESEMGMQKSLTKKIELQKDISKVTRGIINTGKSFTETELTSPLECNNHGTYDMDSDRCICDGNWDPEFLCGQCKPGYGGKQSDDLLHSYTVAKCVETINWNSVTDTIVHDGVTYKKYLVACTYNCG